MTRFLLRSVKRLAVTVAGFAVLLLGVIMLLTPGPGLAAIVAGLAILSTQYAWARNALDKAKVRAIRTRDAAARRAHVRPTDRRRAS